MCVCGRGVFVCVYMYVCVCVFYMKICKHLYEIFKCLIVYDYKIGIWEVLGTINFIWPSSQPWAFWPKR